MLVFRKYWIIFLGSFVLIWIGILGFISYRNGILPLSLVKVFRTPETGTIVKRLHRVEKWDSVAGWLYLTRDTAKIMVGVDVPRIKVIITDKDGENSIVSGSDSRWASLFCEGDNVLLIYSVSEGGDMDLFEIRNNGERNCGEN